MRKRKVCAKNLRRKVNNQLEKAKRLCLREERAEEADGVQKQLQKTLCKSTKSRLKMEKKEKSLNNDDGESSKKEKA